MEQSAGIVIIKKFVEDNNCIKSYSIRFCDFSENKFIFIFKNFEKVFDKLEKYDKIN